MNPRINKHPEILIHHSQVPAAAAAASPAQLPFEEMVNYCCSEGIKWSEGNNTCIKIKSVDEKIPLELMSVCLGTAEICCIRQYRSAECLEGMKAARSGNTCNRDPKTLTAFESDYYKDCCEACKVGLVMSSMVNQCGLKSFAFGSPWDEVSRTCCDESFDSSSFELDENDESEWKEMRLSSGKILIKICINFQRICAVALKTYAPRSARTATRPTSASATLDSYCWRTKSLAPPLWPTYPKT